MHIRHYVVCTAPLGTSVHPSMTPCIGHLHCVPCQPYITSTAHFTALNCTVHSALVFSKYIIQGFLDIVSNLYMKHKMYIYTLNSMNVFFCQEACNLEKLRKDFNETTVNFVLDRLWVIPAIHWVYIGR